MTYPEPFPETAFEAIAVNPIRVGVIGTGFGASLHLSALRENPDFVTTAICSRRPERARAAAFDHGIPAHRSDYRELVRDDDVDAVIVASPPHLHHGMAFEALEEGKLVLCVNPIERYLAEARDMLRIAVRVGSVT
ncbi:MAG: Gfo/Idh/MocA family protein, partial [Thermomicrobiales bacterium]